MLSYLQVRFLVTENLVFTAKIYIATLDRFQITVFAMGQNSVLDGYTCLKYSMRMHSY